MGSSAARRRIFMVAHGGRADLPELMSQAVRQLGEADIDTVMSAADAARISGEVTVATDVADPCINCELVLVFGGDGTILRAAALARTAGIPLLGVNLGHMGFLAESEPEALPAVIDAVAARDYEVEERLSLELRVFLPDGQVQVGWALNEVSIEKASRERMVEFVLAIDDAPLSTMAADGLVCATPTGSTAYAWSAGGPVVWPQVEALVVVPISAHALFSRPLVVDPSSEIDVEVLESGSSAVAWCDGGRMIEVPVGSRFEVRRSAFPVRLARLHQDSFTSRLVRKFDLPVRGWRGRGNFPVSGDAQ